MSLWWSDFVREKRYRIQTSQTRTTKYTWCFCLTICFAMQLCISGRSKRNYITDGNEASHSVRRQTREKWCNWRRRGFTEAAADSRVRLFLNFHNLNFWWALLRGPQVTFKKLWQGAPRASREVLPAAAADCTARFLQLACSPPLPSPPSHHHRRRPTKHDTKNRRKKLNRKFMSYYQHYTVFWCKRHMTKLLQVLVLDLHRYMA